jgi:hypothetical protein
MWSWPRQLPARGSDQEPRTEPRTARMRGVRAPYRRTAHPAPPDRGCAAGCAVGGPTPRPRRTGGHPPRGRGGPLTAASPGSAAGPHHPSQPTGRLSRYPTRTPSAVSGHADTRKRRSAGRSRLFTGPARDPQAAAHAPTLKPIWTYAGPWRIGRRQEDPFPLVMPPRGASRPQTRGRLAPLWGSGAAGPSGALRAIDRRVRAWAGLRRYQPDLVVTHGGNQGLLVF